MKYYDCRLVIFQNIMLLKFSYEEKNLVEKLSFTRFACVIGLYKSKSNKFLCLSVRAISIFASLLLLGMVIVPRDCCLRTKILFLWKNAKVICDKSDKRVDFSFLRIETGQLGSGINSAPGSF